MLGTDIRDPSGMASDFAKLLLYPEKVQNVEMAWVRQGIEVCGCDKKYQYIIRVKGNFMLPLSNKNTSY